MFNTLPKMPTMPEFKRTKSGYEIRAEILNLAKSFVIDDYHAKFHEWEIDVGKDSKTGELVTAINMPQFPGMEQVLGAAEKMYSFVNQTTKSK